METANLIICLLCVPQNPDEDEETRQYRLRIEEQKRLREEILKRKEMRRQMQAGVRKKELLDRLSSQTNTPNQSPAPSQNRPLQQTQQTTQPVQHQQPIQPQQQLEQKQPPQQQRQFPQRTQQSLNQSLKGPFSAAPVPPNCSPQNITPRPNVKSRLQMAIGSTQQQQAAKCGQPQQSQQQHLQQRKNSAVQNLNRPGARTQLNQVTQKNIALIPSVDPGQTVAQGPKPGAKRTVMQRANIPLTEGQQLPQKVRVVKLSGAVSMQFYFHTALFFNCRWGSNFYLILLNTFKRQGTWQLWKDGTDSPPAVYFVVRQISNLWEWQGNVCVVLAELICQVSPLKCGSWYLSRSVSTRILPLEWIKESGMTFICRLGHLIASLLKVDLLLLGQKSVLLLN